MSAKYQFQNYYTKAMGLVALQSKSLPGANRNILSLSPRCQLIQIVPLRARRNLVRVESIRNRIKLSRNHLTLLFMTSVVQSTAHHEAMRPETDLQACALKTQFPKHHLSTIIILVPRMKRNLRNHIRRGTRVVNTHPPLFIHGTLYHKYQPVLRKSRGPLPKQSEDRMHQTRVSHLKCRRSLVITSPRL